MTDVGNKPSIKIELVHRDKHGNIKSVETSEFVMGTTGQYEEVKK